MQVSITRTENALLIFLQPRVEILMGWTDWTYNIRSWLSVWCHIDPVFTLSIIIFNFFQDLCTLLISNINFQVDHLIYTRCLYALNNQDLSHFLFRLLLSVRHFHQTQKVLLIHCNILTRYNYIVCKPDKATKKFFHFSIIYYWAWGKSKIAATPIYFSLIAKNVKKPGGCTSILIRRWVSKNFFYLGSATISSSKFLSS